ncbi:MAG: helix-turn-helix domain-containing protein [Planctomycetes bacterium]|nr:helix-turn-helix domain-containing protein [Planctomycetota bacterium]
MVGSPSRSKHRWSAWVRQAIEDHKLNSPVARRILAARERAGLTQSQLAKLVGATQGVISRLEDATLPGHSLTMLSEVAAPLDYRVEVRLVKASRFARSRRRHGQPVGWRRPDRRRQSSPSNKCQGAYVTPPSLRSTATQL